MNSAGLRNDCSKEQHYLTAKNVCWASLCETQKHTLQVQFVKCIISLSVIVHMSLKICVHMFMMATCINQLKGHLIYLFIYLLNSLSKTRCIAQVVMLNQNSFAFFAANGVLWITWRFSARQKQIWGETIKKWPQYIMLWWVCAVFSASTMSLSSPSPWCPWFDPQLICWTTFRLGSHCRTRGRTAIMISLEQGLVPTQQRTQRGQQKTLSRKG